jgi:hypothetical protein
MEGSVVVVLVSLKLRNHCLTDQHFPMPFGCEQGCRNTQVVSGTASKDEEKLEKLSDVFAYILPIRSGQCVRAYDIPVVLCR